MKLIDNTVTKLRDTGHIYVASMLKCQKSAVAFVVLCFVAAVEWHAPIHFVFWGKVAIAGIGLANWLVNAYYLRKHWELERKHGPKLPQFQE